MLKYLYKQDLFNLNTNTIIVVVLLFTVIYLSTFVYDLHTVVIEGLDDENIMAMVEKYADRYKEQSNSFHPPGQYSVKRETFNKLYLRDFYIKSSYNSCAIDNDMDWVSEKVLPTLLMNGVRFFDFQVFNIRNEEKPCVGIQKNGDTESISSNNYILLNAAMSELKSNAFTSICPNHKDPLFIHLRCCELMEITYDNIYKILKDVFKLNNKKKNDKNISDIYYKDIFNSAEDNRTFILMTNVHPSNKNNKLKNIFYVEGKDPSNSDTIIAMNHSTIKNLSTTEAKALANYNKKNFTICYPDFPTNNNLYKNYLFPEECDKQPCYPDPMIYGCQFMPLCFSLDKNVEYYHKLFESLQTGFIVKHNSLRIADINLATGTYDGIIGNKDSKVDKLGTKVNESVNPG